MGRHKLFNWIIGPVALTVGMVASGNAQPPLSGPDRVRQELAIQKFEGEVKLTLEDARRLAQTSPERAAARIEGVMTSLSLDKLLPPDRRRALMAQLQDAQAALRSTPQVGEAPRTGFAGGRATTEAQQKAERARAESDEIRKTLREIEALYRDRRFVEAERLASHLSRTHPQNNAAQAMNRRTDMASRIRAADDLLAEYERAVVAALNDIERSAIPPVGDIEFPKDWKERTAGRNPEKLTEKEQAILKSLERPVSLDFQGKAFSVVMQQLSDAMGQPILLDKVALEAVEVDSSAPVTLKLANVSTRTALRKILQDKGLTYIIQNETIQVTSVERARSTLVTQVYYLGDLVRGISPIGGVPHPFFDQIQTAQNAQIIVDMIRTSVDPDSWEPLGPGVVRYHAPTMSLIIRQTAEVHSIMRGKFAR